MSNANDQSNLTRIKQLMGGSFLVYALLVATHLGEFWPFSIYPMFSRGGHPWVRSVVRDVTSDLDNLSDSTARFGDGRFWKPVGTDGLAGEPFPLLPQGINQNDIANFVSKSTEWTHRRIAAMRKVYGSVLSDHALLVYRVEGQLADDRDVAVRYEPFILMSPDTTLLNPDLTIEEGAAE